MNTNHSHTLRARAAGFLRWLTGQDSAQQRVQREQTIPNGVIRQQQDPDYALARGADVRAEASFLERLLAQREQRDAQRRREEQRQAHSHGR